MTWSSKLRALCQRSLPDVDDDTLEYMVSLLSDEDTDLGSMGAPEVIALVAPLIEDSEDAVQRLAHGVIALIGSASASAAGGDKDKMCGSTRATAKLHLASSSTQSSPSLPPPLPPPDGLPQTMSRLPHTVMWVESWVIGIRLVHWRQQSWGDPPRSQQWRPRCS